MRFLISAIVAFFFIFMHAQAQENFGEGEAARNLGKKKKGYYFNYAPYDFHYDWEVHDKKGPVVIRDHPVYVRAEPVHNWHNNKGYDNYWNNYNHAWW